MATVSEVKMQFILSEGFGFEHVCGLQFDWPKDKFRMILQHFGDSLTTQFLSLEAQEHYRERSEHTKKC